jgi:glycine hydroxymethyltransferase
MTTRGFREVEAEQLAMLIADVLETPRDEKVIRHVAGEVKRLCEKYPVYRR